MAIPTVFQSRRRVKTAIDSARAFSEERGVPLTVERLAVCLGTTCRQVLDLAMGEDTAGDACQPARELLRAACEEVAAGLVEHGMKNSATMDMLMLKHHFRYSDKGDGGTAAAVVFFGEDALPE